jgi:hypothetical protein
MEKCMRTKFYITLIKGAMETYKILKFSFGEKSRSQSVNLNVLSDLNRGEFQSITTTPRKQ